MNRNSRRVECAIKKRYLLPNFHIRIGPSKFNIQAGLSDRYVGVYNPISAHLSFAGIILKNKTQIQMGIINQFSEFPF